MCQASDPLAPADEFEAGCWAPSLDAALGAPGGADFELEASAAASSFRNLSCEVSPSSDFDLLDCSLTVGSAAFCATLPLASMLPLANFLAISGWSPAGFPTDGPGAEGTMIDAAGAGAAAGAAGSDCSSAEKGALAATGAGAGTGALYGCTGGGGAGADGSAGTGFEVGVTGGGGATVGDSFSTAACSDDYRHEKRTETRICHRVLNIVFTASTGTGAAHGAAAAGAWHCPADGERSPKARRKKQQLMLKEAVKMQVPQAGTPPQPLATVQQPAVSLSLEPAHCMGGRQTQMLQRKRHGEPSLCDNGWGGSRRHLWCHDTIGLRPHVRVHGHGGHHGVHKWTHHGIRVCEGHRPQRRHAKTSWWTRRATSAFATFPPLWSGRATHPCRTRLPQAVSFYCRCWRWSRRGCSRVLKTLHLSVRLMHAVIASTLPAECLECRGIILVTLTSSWFASGIC